MNFFNFNKTQEPDTVDNVLSAFTDQLNRLQQIAQNEFKRSENLLAVAQAAKQDADKAAAESKRAFSVADKINALIS